MQDVIAKLEALSARADDQQRKLHRSQTITVVVYVVLVIFVFAYTFALVPMIRQATSHEAVAEHISGMINSIPTYRAQLIAQYDQNADKWAAQTVDATIYALFRPADMTPGKGQAWALADSALAMASAGPEEGVLAAVGEDVITSYTDMLAEHVREELIPSFTKAIKANAPELKEHYATLKDKEVGEGIVLLMMDTVNEELDKWINDEFIAAADDLEVRLRKLARPDPERTVREDAKRQLLMYWWHLNNQASDDDYVTVFKGLIDQFLTEFHLKVWEETIDEITGEAENPAGEEMDGEAHAEEL